MSTERRTLKLTSPIMTGEDVKEAQRALTALGFPCGDIDGKFGEMTNKAGKAFKATLLTGDIDAATWAALLVAAPPISTTKIDEFIARLKREVENGSIYVWGAQGEDEITEAWIRHRETTTANADRALAFWKRQISLGYGDTLRAFDCSGLIVCILNEMGLYKGDLSSRGLYAKCDKLARGDLQPGDLVFRHNGAVIYHVGVYIGNGLVIEAMGRDRGVVMRDINASGLTYWNRYGRFDILSK